MSTLRETLDAELQTLVRRHAKIEGHLRNADGLTQDWADRATLHENDEVLEALDDRTRERIAALRVALDRMDSADWGLCTGCETRIPDKRLEILPTTRLCVSCAHAAGG